MLSFALTPSWIAVLLLWLFLITRSLFFWLYYLQVKQYRLDRLWVSLRQRSFLRLVLSPYRLILLLLLILQAVPSLSRESLIGFFLVGTFMVIRLFKQPWKMPAITAKIWALFAVLFLGEVALVFWASFSLKSLLLIEVIQPLIVFLIFSVLLLPNQFLFSRLKKQARAYRQQFPHVKVIGITGSYGKTSMKELLAFLLATKYKVLKTPGHVNVDTGIANVTLNELNEDIEYFLVEMGAYTKGEIKSSCDIVQPEYAILTGLGRQHLELFGSEQAIQEGKFELVKAVNDEKKTFANNDSEKLKKAFVEQKVHPHYYGLKNNAETHPTQLVYQDHVTTFHFQGKSFETFLFGKAHLTNLIGAISVAHELGLTLTELQKAVKDVPQIPHTMERYGLNHDSLLIDDTYNANTEGVIQSCLDLREVKNKTRIVVFHEVAELGDKAKEEHERIAKAIAMSADKVVLLPSIWSAWIRTSLINYGYKSSQIFEKKDLASQSQFFHDAIILCEGRGASGFAEQFKQAGV